MREYKFRGLLQEYCEPEVWKYGALASTINRSGERFDIEPSPCSLIIEFQYDDKVELSYYFVKPETVGQYTGLKDKGGREIFEGDIVRVVTYDDDEDSAVCEIKYENLSFCISEISDRYIWEPDTEVEIIGNIHENPELLEKGEKNEK